MLFDTHAHYDDKQFDEDRDELLSSMQENNVGLIVNAGCDLKSTKKSIEIAEKYDFVYCTAGYHPEAADKATKEKLLEIEKLASHPKVKAIGEIGLDYYWEDCCPREKQKEVFAYQMDMARRLNLPVVIHDREAHEDCFEIVKKFPEVTVVYHCYSGSKEMAKELIKLGHYISFTGVITFKNARKAVETVEAIPMDRIMIETDSPYLAPVPNRGKRNSSLNVQYVAQKIAEVKGMTAEEVMHITTENGKRFFRI